VTELPIFVPHDGGHLAAVVTVPERPPRGLVLMLPGASLDESIGSYLLFQRAAPRLSEAGLASVRLDFFGLGDSTGDADAWPLGEIEPALEQAETVLAAVRQDVDVPRFAIASLCYGGRVALRMTKHPDCVGAVCLAPPLIERGARTQLRRKYARSSSVAAFVRRHEFLRRSIVQPLRRALTERKPTSLVQEALGELSHARVLVLYSESEAGRDLYRMRAAQSLEAMGERLAPGQRERFGVELLPTDPLAGFDLMPPESQNLVLDRVVAWLEESFGGTGPQGGRGSERSVA
jgi:pimeloyl-ACP methyl ester carboxylesterase